ncbi:SDR family oxidoreductase [Leclercia adecarboxylata]|uniref:SDR family NAD(P)-dependent oxidoreductase n=1 Tax=Leclercia adecarboxylata TaxID=83655 RepID=UPI002DBA58FF|nr:SDR family oxidoreductase [Leclercia adecarboxylata]MEB6377504.1 SDR family oxidoreductase [Leclercia adecarboxylata]
MSDSAKGTAVVTGASTGMGALYAARLARMGYDLIIVARNHNRLNQMASHITADSARNVEVMAADLNDTQQLAALEERLRSDASITLLVNNAGMGTHTQLVDSNVEQMTSMINLNVVALTRLTYAVVPGFVKRGRGAIINIASIVGIAPEVLNGVYGGSKAYVLAFTRSLHRELADKGIQVQAVLPGATATPFWDNGGLPLSQLDPGIVMQAEEMVNAALVGFQRGELITIPSLHDESRLQQWEQARQAIMADFSHNVPAARYRASSSQG